MIASYMMDQDGSGATPSYTTPATPTAAPAAPAPAPAPAPTPAPGAPPPVSLQYPAPAPAPAMPAAKGMVAQSMKPITIPEAGGSQEPSPFVAPPNPYSNADAPKVGVIGGQMAAPQVTGANTAANIAQVDPSSYTGAPKAGTAVAGTAVGNGYDATHATGTHWNVDDNSTVAGQIAKITAADGELSQQARTRAAQAANSKGLINSSMAVQAGESAVLNAALPIAQQDATTYGSAGKTNAEIDNNTSQVNAASDNRASEFSASAGNTASLANANAATDVSKSNAGADNALQSQDIDNKAKAATTNVGLKADAAKFDAQTSLQASLANQDASIKQSMQTYDVASKAAMQNADAETKLQLQNIDATTRTSLADIEAKYKTQMQTSQSVASSYQSMVDNIGRVMADKDMDAGSKQTAIENLRVLYVNQMQMQSTISHLDLGTLISGTALGNVGAGSGAVQASNDASERAAVMPGGSNTGGVAGSINTGNGGSNPGGF